MKELDAVRSRNYLRAKKNVEERVGHSVDKVHNEMRKVLKYKERIKKERLRKSHSALLAKWKEVRKDKNLTTAPRINHDDIKLLAQT